MKLTRQTNAADFAAKLIERIKDLEPRERIVLSFEFGTSINRIEIYMGETPTNSGSLGIMFGGKQFSNVVTLQQFNDYTNKSVSKTSYSYETELIQFIPKLISKLNATLYQSEMV